jgi:hypothetical protein
MPSTQMFKILWSTFLASRPEKGWSGYSVAEYKESIQKYVSAIQANNFWPNSSEERDIWTIFETWGQVENFDEPPVAGNPGQAAFETLCKRLFDQGWKTPFDALTTKDLSQWRTNLKRAKTLVKPWGTRPPKQNEVVAFSEVYAQAIFGYAQHRALRHFLHSVEFGARSSVELKPDVIKYIQQDPDLLKRYNPAAFGQKTAVKEETLRLAQMTPEVQAALVREIRRLASKG